MSPTSVHLISLGCARNDVDSEELAGRLAAGGFALVEDPDEAAAIVVNTCGFIDAAKNESIQTLLAASEHKVAGGPRAVIAVGCLAERYGAQLADSLPEADAVLGFDDYPEIAERLNLILAGGRHASHQPRDRRELLPITPVARPATSLSVPGHGQNPDRTGPASGPRSWRKRLQDGPSAPLKIASGCDRRCAFCAIPSFRGAFLSRPADEVVAEARWLVEAGVREIVLVSENSTAWGKDIGDNLESLLARLNLVDGLEWIRVAYLQPAEVRPSLIAAMLELERVVAYFDLPFQHAAPTVLGRMRRFGDPDAFLGLISRVRSGEPEAGIRTNVITGFPGETEEEFSILADFLAEAGLDAVGVFGYSDEEGTEAARMPDKVPEEIIAERVDRLATLADLVAAERAAARVQQRVQVLIEYSEVDQVIGRARHQAPETDGQVSVLCHGRRPTPGEMVWGRVASADGVDLAVELEER